MITSGNVPEHLVIGARTGFLAAISNAALPWRQVADEIPMTTKGLELVDIGGAPMPVEDSDGGPFRGMVEKLLKITTQNWNVTVGISYNAVKDDQTGTLLTKVQSAGDNFNRGINKLVFSALNAGDAATYGYGYDGLVEYSASHKDAGGTYQTVQSNLPSVALSEANFATVMATARGFMDDQGVYVEHNYNTLIVPPAYEWIAAQITGNPSDYSTANRAVNPYTGMNLIVTPWLDSTAWILAATGEAQKPIYVAMREAPNLQLSWFDPLGADGGMYYFKFYGRYTVAYGDWRLSILGHS